MKTEARPSGVIVATLGLPDPFRYADQQGLDVFEDDEANHNDLFGPEVTMEFVAVLEGDEQVILLSTARERAKARGSAGGLRAWWRVSEGYSALSDDLRRQFAGKWLYFPNTVLRRRYDGGLFVASLYCDDVDCDRYFGCLDGGFDSDDRVALLRGLPTQAGK